MLNARIRHCLPLFRFSHLFLLLYCVQEMHIHSFIFPVLYATFVSAAAFDPFSYAPNLSPESSNALVTRLSTSRSWNSSRQTRLDSRRPRWLQPSAIGRQDQIPNRVVKKSTSVKGLDTRPTPEPTGDPSSSTTVYINDEKDFALIAPQNAQGIFH